MDDFEYKGWDLHGAIDALMAYDLGATDSGVKDDSMKAAVRAYLGRLPILDLHATLTGYVRCMLGDGEYGIEDVVQFLGWLDEEMQVRF